MNHLMEEELVAQAYGEGADAASAHLRECPACGRALAELRSDLAELRATEAPERDEEYGSGVWRAIAGTLPAYAAPKRQWFGGRSGMHWMRGLGYAAACAALVAGGFLAGSRWEHGRSGTVARNNAPPAKPTLKQPIVVVVLSDHLDRSERLLVELKHVDVENTDMIPPLRDEARTLLAANREARRKAEESGDPELKSALDRLDRLFAQIADHPNEMNAAALTRIKEEMDRDGLLFEVRVLRARARDHAAGKSQLSGGAA